jgi:hypothetical protein
MYIAILVILAFPYALAFYVVVQGCRELKAPKSKDI